MTDVLPLLPPGWGLFPTVLGLPSYLVFALLALIAGTVCFLLGARRLGLGLEPSAIVLIFALLGAGIGAKLPILLLYFNGYVRSPASLLTGKTMLGGIAGALAAAVLAKKLFHIRGAGAVLGDAAAPAAALALTIGRVGCLGAGCCYGKPAPWGLNLGDGVTRWPTQLFESMFHLLALAVLLVLLRRHRARGLLLPGYLASYLLFRYATEFLRDGAPSFGGQSIYQLFCIGGLLLLAAWAFPRLRKRAGTRFR